MHLPSYVLKALSLLNEKGFDAYVVGGAVRDELRGESAHDFDITTSALPHETQEVFHEFKTVETGLSHGTLTVLIENVPLEITTYRIDGDYTDARHPNSVTFTRSLKEDAARRDFTVNAMSYHPAKGVMDFFGGKEDLKNETIRAVGDPHRRFSEDALRILRAMRFAAVLDFNIEKSTALAMREKKEGLLKISTERIREEFAKLLCGKAARRVLSEFRDVIAVFIPEAEELFDFDQKSCHHEFDLWEHTLRVTENAPPNVKMRLSAFLHDFGKPHVFSIDPKGEGHFYGHAEKSTEISENILTRLKFDNKTKEDVLRLVKYHDTLPEPQTRQFARFRSRFGEEFLTDWIALIRADRKGQTTVFPAEKEQTLLSYECAVRELLLKEERLELCSLAIGGKDLITMGIKPGKEIGRMLSEAFEAVLENKIPNERTALLRFLGFKL